MMVGGQELRLKVRGRVDGKAATRQAPVARSKRWSGERVLVKVRCAIVAIVLLAAGATGASVSGAAKKSLDCATSGHTMVKTKRVRVFRIGSYELYDAYACILPRGRVRHLGHYEDYGAGEWEGVYGFVVAGSFVAFEDAFCDRTDCDGSIKSFNVATRQMLHRARIPIDGRRFFVLLVNRRGSVAWTRGTTVWKCDAPKCVLLDRSRLLDVNSLTRHGNRLHWAHTDGTAYSARLR